MSDVAMATIGLVHAKRAESFRASLRVVTRQYARGEINRGDFVVGFINAIEIGFRNAWKTGAATCGIKPQELENRYLDRIQGEVNAQFPFVIGLADRIGVINDAAGINAELAKVDIYAARYGEQVNKARAAVCGEKRLRWELGAAEHCSSCLKLAGIVKTARFWDEAGIYPRVAGAGYLECGGYNCKCSLSPTDDPVTDGPLPRLP